MKIKSELNKIFRFGAVGIANTVVDFIGYNAILMLCANVSVAKCVSYILGAVNSFILNKLWTFKIKGTDTKRELLIFGAVNLISLGFCTWAISYVNGFIAGIMNAPAPVSANLANLIVIGCTLVINYIGARIFVFRERK